MKPQSWWQYKVILSVIAMNIILVHMWWRCFCNSQVSREVYTSPSKSAHFISFTPDIVHLTAIHYIGISEWVSDFEHS